MADRIRSELPTLTPAERRVGTAVLSRYPSTALLTSQALAELSGTSGASVVRFVSKLGFDGMAAFQSSVRDEIDRRLSSPFELYPPGVGDTTPLDAMAALQVGLVTETLGRLTEQSVVTLAQMLLKSRQVLLWGGPFSLTIAHYLYAHLLLFRPRVTLLNSPFAPLAEQMVDLGPRSCAVVFDFRRYSPEAVFVTEAVKKRRGRVIVVTDPYLSPATQYADEVVICSTERPQILDSYTGVIAVIDTVVSEMWRAEPDRLTAHLDAVERSRAQMVMTMSKAEVRDA